MSEKDQVIEALQTMADNEEDQEIKDKFLAGISYVQQLEENSPLLEFFKSYDRTNWVPPEM